MRLILKVVILLFLNAVSIFAQIEESIVEETQGYNILPFDNSFFRHYDSELCNLENRFTEIEYFAVNEIDTDLDVVYATDVIDWEGNSQDLAMDFYYPSLSIDELEKRPFVLLIHGGSFLFGSKTNLKRHCEEFAKRGFVAATLEYRLGWNTARPIDQGRASYRAHQDAHAAMRFISANSDSFNIDTEAMFIGGHSAGAVTSLNIIYVDESEWTTRFPGIVSELGSLSTSGNNLANTFNLQGVFNNWGSNRGANMQVEELVPSIAFHGALDSTVPIGITPQGAYGSGALHDLLLANGICSEINIDPQGGHGIYNDAEGIVFRVGRTSCFFKSIFCEECSSFYTEEQIFSECSVSTEIDNDGDGFIIGDDCDDTNPNINSNQKEIPYNGLDDDCNTSTFDDDLDQDGFVIADDCDDTNPDINPDAEEIVSNGIDEDCDGMDLTTSTYEISKTVVNIFPNPATHVFNIEINGKLDLEVTLYDLNGKIVDTKKNKSEYKIPANADGIYIIEIKDVKSGKRIVERIVFNR